MQLHEGSAVSGFVLSDKLKSLDRRSMKVKLIVRASSDIVAMVTTRVLPLLEPGTPATL
jgi:mRNA interferase MazF